jgi:hypothetical protein
MRKVSNFWPIIALGLVIIAYNFYTKEGFGTSPGTMVQLQTSHVPTAEDVFYYNSIYPKIVRKDITDMTGDDPGEIMPWYFPWFGRGMVNIAL